MNVDTYFDRFFDEKEIPFQSFEVEDSQGRTHYLDTEVVIENIKAAPQGEKEQVRNVLVRLDFNNAPIVPFLKHLAEGLVAHY